MTGFFDNLLVREMQLIMEKHGSPDNHHYPSILLLTSFFITQMYNTLFSV